MSTALAERSWCVMVPHHARGAHAARHRLIAELSKTISTALLDDVVAVAGELVGNAVRHADPLPGGVVRVTWRLRPGGAAADVVQVRVTDGGSTAPPRARVVGPEAIDGRGLTIVAALAARWGVERDGLGQSVWAEVCCPARPPLAAVRRRPTADRHAGGPSGSAGSGGCA